MTNKIETIKMADDRTTKAKPSILALSKLYLVHEPSEHSVGSGIFHLALLTDSDSFYFLNSKKTYPADKVLPLISENEKFMCVFPGKTAVLDAKFVSKYGSQKSNIWVGQNFKHFCDCNHVCRQEIATMNFQQNSTKKMKTRCKTLCIMKSSVENLKNRQTISVEELLPYERFLTCVQEKGIKQERSQEELLVF